VTDLIRLLTRAQKLLRTASDEAMSRHGVRVGQNLVLEPLWEHDGLTPGEIAAQLGVSTPTVVNAAHRMVAAGLVERHPDAHDRRLVRLFLTARGRAAQRPIEQARERLAEHAFATLTAAERRHLRSGLEKIISQMSAPPA
jgi:MarR family transcriptional regulator, organic hydroperoxide resistance regulator